MPSITINTILSLLWREGFKTDQLSIRRMLVQIASDTGDTESVALAGLITFYPLVASEGFKMLKLGGRRFNKNCCCFFKCFNVCTY